MSSEEIVSSGPKLSTQWRKGNNAIKSVIDFIVSTGQSNTHVELKPRIEFNVPRLIDTDRQTDTGEPPRGNEHSSPIF